MEPLPFDRRETEPTNEHEPQPRDVALATREILRELAPDADADDLRENIALIEEAADLEEAGGYALSCFAYFDLDPDEGMARLADILQFQAVLPNGDQVSKPEASLE